MFSSRQWLLGFSLAHNFNGQDQCNDNQQLLVGHFYGLQLLSCENDINPNIFSDDRTKIKEEPLERGAVKDKQSWNVRKQ